MVWIAALIVIGGGVLVWIVRAKRGPGREVEDLRRRNESPLAHLVGVPVGRLRDVRLAAVILMLQLVRTGSPVTAAEKTKILEFMEDPLRVEAASAMFEVAWGYTQARRPFAQLADALLPLLRERLTLDERLQLVDMLNSVASAHSATGELQRKAIAGLRRQLVVASPALRANRTGASARWRQ